jgi:hypothetical protein
LAGPWLRKISFFFLYFYFIKLSGTKLQVWVDLFFGLQVVDFGVVVGFSGGDFREFGA